MGTLLRFLVGDRGAILRLAGDRRAIWAGLLCVLAAGLAREYDGADLTRQPWLLLVPPAASLGVSFLLFAGVYWAIGRSAKSEGTVPPRFWAAYRAFLTLFWMTAPLALLYAVPYERFLSPGGAMRANLWTLALVAVWRVLLITRVLSVLTGRGKWPLLFAVMLIGDIVLIAALWLMPTPILNFMGGVRLTEPEAVLRSTSFLAGMFAWFSLPVWLLGGIGVLATGRMGWNVPVELPPKQTRGLVWMAAATVALWALFLPQAQREQRLRTSVERDMRSGRIVEALATMSAHAPGDFPPQWDPPPRPSYGDADSRLLDVLEVIIDRGAAEWVRAIYVSKLERSYLDEFIRFRFWPDSPIMNEWERVERILDRLPEGPTLRTEKSSIIAEVRNRIAADFDSATRPTTLPATVPATAPAGGPP